MLMLRGKEEDWKATYIYMPKQIVANVNIQLVFWIVIC